MFAFIFSSGTLFTSIFIRYDLHEQSLSPLLDVLIGLEKGSSEWAEVIVQLFLIDM